MAFNKAKAMQEAAKLLSGGKIQQAIQMYRRILDKDPSDLTLLNTIGDLYLREKNVSDALASYHQLADTYCKEGFTVKAIAIYKKIAKIELNTAEPLLKLAELYMLQGLAREARDHFGQAVEFFRKKNQHDKALDVYRKILSLDPENVNYRMKFAEFCEQTGKKSDAARAYTDLAEMALKRGDVNAAESALKRAAQYESGAPGVQLLRARVALAKRDFAQAEQIVESSPALRELPEGAKILLEAYLAGQKLDQAEKLVEKVWRAHPDTFAPVASFASLAADHGQYDAACRVLSLAAETLLERKQTAELSESLKLVWAKAQNHIPTLELLYRVSEASADENTIPDVLEALGHAYVQSDRLEDAEAAYQRLVAREPANAHYKGLLKQTQERAGKEPTLTGAAKALEDVELAPVIEPEPAGAPEAGEEEGAAVKEALENSDLFSRYGLVDKAVAELEKTLAAYPDQVDIHRRILEICHRSQPERAQQAAEELARIFTKRGEAEEAQRYESLRNKLAAGAGLEELVAPAAPEPGPPAAQEFDLGAQFPAATEEPAAEAPAAGPPPEMPIPGFSEPVAPPPAPIQEAQELDFSSDFEAFAGGGGPAAAPPKETFNYDESRVEIDFYLEQGLIDEARTAIESLEQQFPGHPKVAELRERMETFGALAGGGGEVVEAPPEPEPEPVTTAPETGRQAGWDLPESFAPSPPVEEPAAPPEPEWAGPAPFPPAPEPEPVPAAEAAGANLLGDLASDLAGSLEGIRVPETPPPARGSAAAGAGAAPAGGEGMFSDLLDELRGGAEAEGQAEDPETHYNLGVAFREMGLLDEAIGEFQKVVKGVKGETPPPNFLQACTLLAACFMDKELPAIAAKWYARALEAPDLNEESVLALQYDLGVAYEKAGDVRTALAKFSEVYAHNIDYRDVAEKIRQLQKGA
jgi:tetratricopeptide (TPR) repeat protein